MLKEPVYGTQFDLNKLHSDLVRKIGGADKDILEFNVCEKNLTKVCAGAKSAACLTRNGKEYKFGNFICFNFWEKKIDFIDIQRADNWIVLTKWKSGTQLDAEPIYTNGLIYFNFTGDTCDKNTNEPFTLIIMTVCDYSSHIKEPLILMPYVSCIAQIISFWAYMICNWWMLKNDGFYL